MTGEQKPGGLEALAVACARRVKDCEGYSETSGELDAWIASQPDLWAVLVGTFRKGLTAITPAEPAEARIRELEAEIERMKLGCAKQNDEVCQSLGRALGYPAFVDDQVNFPGATDADGVCVGDHVAESIADEAARRIAAAEAKLARAVELVKKAKDLDVALLHDGYDNGPGGGNYVYADVVRTDELFPLLDQTLAALQQEKTE